MSFRLRTQLLCKYALICLVVITTIRLQAQSVELHAKDNDPIYVDKHYVQADPRITFYNLGYQSGDPATPLFTTKAYLSKDTIPSNDDYLLGTINSRITSQGDFYRNDFDGGKFSIPATAEAGKYYLLIFVDANNVIAENDETDNVSKTLVVLTGYIPLPIRNDIETNPIDYWRSYQEFTAHNAYSQDTSLWSRGQSSIAIIRGVRSGQNAFFTSRRPVTADGGHSNILQSPLIDMSGRSGDVACFWFRKDSETGAEAFQFQVAHASQQPFRFNANDNTSESFYIPAQRFADWDCMCIDLRFIQEKPHTRVRWEFKSDRHIVGRKGLAAIDDIYIGQPLADLSLVETGPRILDRSGQPTFWYTLINGGAALSTAGNTTELYFSTDEILDPSDQLVATNTEPRLTPINFSRREATLDLSAIGSPETGFVIVVLDAQDIETEIWEQNNTFAHPVTFTNRIAAPVLFNFENDQEGWTIEKNGQDIDFNYGTPPNDFGYSLQGLVDQKAFYGEIRENATSANQEAYLTSPVIDISALDLPVLGFNYAVEGEYNFGEYVASLEYSINGGQTFIPFPSSQTSQVNFFDWDPSSATRVGWSTNMIPGGDHGMLPDLYRDFGREPVSPLRAEVIIPDDAVQANSFLLRFVIATAKLSTPLKIVIDDVSITEGRSNMVLDRPRFISPPKANGLISFVGYLRNQGNYVSSGTTITWSLSNDLTPSSDDIQLGTSILDAVQPGSRREEMFNLQLPVDAPHTGKHLLYELKDRGIAADPVTAQEAIPITSPLPPYSESFTDFAPDGWLGYAERDDFPDTLFPPLVALRTGFYHGERPPLNGGAGLRTPGEHEGTAYFFGSTFNPGWTTNYTWYLQSPTFDLSGVNNAEIRFKLWALDKGGDSGTVLEYSLNRGESWLTLTDTTGSLNWYNRYSRFFGGRVWAQDGSELDDPTNLFPLGMKQRARDISELTGERNVTFRIKHYLGSTFALDPFGIRGIIFDDFEINSALTDLEASAASQATTLNPWDTSLELNYTIRNISGIDADTSYVGAYWSADDQWDPTDRAAGSISVGEIAAGEEASGQLTVSGPLGPFSSSTAFLIVRADFESELTELDEINNDAILIFQLTSGGNWQTTNAESISLREGAVDPSLTFSSEGPSPSVATTVRFTLAADPTGTGSTLPLSTSPLASTAAGSHAEIEVPLMGVDFTEWPYLITEIDIDQWSPEEYRIDDNRSVLHLIRDTTSNTSSVIELKEELQGYAFRQNDQLWFCGSAQAKQFGVEAIELIAPDGRILESRSKLQLGRCGLLKLNTYIQNGSINYLRLQLGDGSMETIGF